MLRARAGFGGGDVIEQNLLANCVRESGDHGPYNSWDRVPYITDIGSAERGEGKSSVIPAWRHIRHNLMLSLYSSQEAIDTDDGSAYYKVGATLAPRPSPTHTHTPTRTEYYTGIIDAWEPLSLNPAPPPRSHRRTRTSFPTPPTGSSPTSTATTTATTGTFTPRCRTAGAEATVTGS
jgi:hypothetical protein